MSPMRLIILLVAAGAAVAAVFLVRSMKAPAPAAASIAVHAAPVPVAPTNEVLVARHPIEAGKFIVVDDLKWESWPDNAANKAFVDKKSSPDALEGAVGAVATISMVEGEPVILSRLVHPGQAGFMSAMLTPGMRAVAIEIRPETAAGGFIQPNDRVDVLVTREVAVNKAEGSATMQNVRSDMILQNIRVLAIDTNYGSPPPPAEEKAKGDKGDKGEKTTGEQGTTIEGTRAVLELTESDATLLASAKKAGELSLTLRSVSGMDDHSGATRIGQIYRDGLPKESQGVRIYRYGTETIKAPAG